MASESSRFQSQSQHHASADTPPHGLDVGPGEGPSLAQLFGTSAEDVHLDPRAPRVLEAGERWAWQLEPERRGFLDRLVRASLKVTILSIVAWGLLFNFSEVRGSSMAPGIHDHDRILVDNLSLMIGDVERGDIVVLRYPLDPSLDYIKRVVGLPGEEVRIDGGRLWIDGVLLEEPYVAQEAIDPFTRMVTRVQPGHYFVLGDNRLRSSDSREFGQVPHSNLRGKVRLCLWPPDRAGWID